jgi:hypothetical protein
MTFTGESVTVEFLDLDKSVVKVNANALEKDRLLMCLWHKSKEHPTLPDDFVFSTASETRGKNLMTGLDQYFGHCEKK